MGVFRAFARKVVQVWVTVMLTLVPALASAVTYPPCLFELDKVSDPLRFRDFHVAVPAPRTPAAPVLDSNDAKMFRTVLRAAAAQGPNFAGHYTVAVWGCGSSCSDFVIVDAVSGRVTFDNALRAISGIYVWGVADGYNSLRFRRDSRLLVILGAPNEDETRDGVGFYDWTGVSLKLLRFVPGAAACERSLD